MVRLFSHWFPSSTVLQVAVDAILLFIAFVLAAVWLNQGSVPGLRPLVPSAALFAVAMVAVNSALGLYQRDATRTIMHGLARMFVALATALPIAYVMLSVLPVEEPPHDAVKLTALVALGAFVVIRGVANSRG
jgi:FlaA1/EpsC-like NDP-sugar epimerase